MRDYYTAYVSARVEKTQERAETEGAKGAEGSFEPFAPSVDYESPENLPLDIPASVLDEDGPGTDTFEERIAIMMFDGGLTEVEALRFLTWYQRYQNKIEFRPPVSGFPRVHREPICDFAVLC